jgi:hypothetical protein
VQSSLASIKSSKGKQKAKGVDSAEDIATHQKQTSADNLVGKINNLVTTDLGNLVDGRDFLFLGVVS